MTEGPFYSTGRWTFDVFLNFRGVDTRAGFTSNLCNSLRQRGIRTFFDDDDLRRGRRINSSLLRAIEESKVAIVVFSPNYATSSYCLDELAHILSCCKGEDRLVLPVFYDVDPSHVRQQSGAFGKALVKHKEQYKVEEEKLQIWRQALYEAANLPGWHIQHGSKSEYMIIRRIIGDVSRKINRTLLYIGNHVVGLESRVRDLTLLLGLDSDEDEEVLMVGIYGMSGVGKTTLVRAVYNLISGQFEAICFLADVRRKACEHGLMKLQETLLSEITGHKDIKFEDVTDIIPILKHRLQRKKVLLVLDDVDWHQFCSLTGQCKWFGSGSRIIITTRSPFVLRIQGVEIYEVMPLNGDEALELFSWKAFENNKPDEGYMEISKRVVHHTGGHPLALEIIGSQLFGKQIAEWHSVVDKYQQIPISDLQKILMVSYDSLDEDVKTIFLDIACCFNGYKLEYITDLLLNGRGLNPKYGIQVLISKSLIKIDDGLVRMHDLIQNLGKDIVEMESPRNPGERSRLWYYEDILYVLKENKGTAKVELMKIDLPKDEEVNWDGNGFENMKSLKILEIINARFSRVPEIFPSNLRVLNWKGYFSEQTGEIPLVC